MSNQLENVQVGDWVKIIFGSEFNPYIAKVTHVTAKQFTVGDYRFWKHSGAYLESSVWGTKKYAKLISEDEVKEEKQRIQKAKMITAIIKDLQSKPELFSFELIEDWVEICFELNQRNN